MPEFDSTDARWKVLQQVVQSPQFEKSSRLRSFLLFICEMALSGQRSRINEQEIGVKVFGRPAGYNPGDDSIVRSQAHILRQRLSEYFTGPGSGSALRIVIPKGTYVPVFEAADAEGAAKEPNSVPGAELPLQESSSGTVKMRHLLWAGILFLAVLILAASFWRIYEVQHTSPQTKVEARFWQSIFGTRRPVVIVPADSNLVLIEEMTNSSVSFQDYQSRKYLENPILKEAESKFSAQFLEDTRYTSMADLNLVACLMRSPQVPNAGLLIRYARDLSITDSREDNLILIGGARSNPWVELFAGKMNFINSYDWQQKKDVVINKLPRKGELPLYMQDSSDPQGRVYGLVTYESSLDGEGSVLLVAGTSSAGTQAAADFLLSNHLFADFLRQVQLPNGSIPHFELLLVARNLNGNVAGSSILASRLSP